METFPLHTSAIDLSALRGILSEDFDAPLVNRVIMCLRTDGPGSTRVALADVRPVLMENFPQNTVDRIIMAMRLSIPLSPE